VRVTVIPEEELLSAIVAVSENRTRFPGEAAMQALRAA
jgi:hypothetical protein